MMELLEGYASDLFAAVWHDALTPEDRRAALPIAERDRVAGKRDVRILAKYARGAKPISSVELAEHQTLGTGQWREFGRIAIITDELWVRHSVQFFAPFFHGPVRVFANAQAQEARVWVGQHDHH